MLRIYWYLGLLMLQSGLLAPAFAHGLPLVVKQKLQQATIPETAVGAYVQEIGINKPIIAVNADLSMNPASVMKLLTTYAGLELLGPAYTWPTLLYANGRMIEGVLYGDLIIKGYGDPKLDLENFWLLIHRLRQTGLHEIKGNLVLDHTHYDIPNGDPGEFDGQPYRTYNILPEALLVNYRTSTIHLFPHPEKNSVRAVIDPLPASLRVQNNLKLTHGTCGNWLNLLTIDAIANEENKNDFTVVLNGSFSSQCGKQSYMLSLQDSAIYTRDLFKHLWAQQGGLFHGDVVAGQAPQNLLPLKTYQSPPLADIIRGINKFSNNIAARQLYLTLGMGDAVINNSPATLAKSDAAIRQWLAAKQLNFPELVVENGSGLSRTERISARHMGQLLLAAFNSPVMPEFISSLPIAAVDGTLKNRFTDTPVKGLAHMKTGALSNVRALAGYLLDKRGRRIIVIFFINHDQAGQSRMAMDTLVQWVYNRN
ncbi:D-alanyl-D-alanine carboxypeptidase/D-alanyl-D-alanine-endopeptidase [Nitrosomonas sp. Nm166]|uniref:D-alanyl-D-alanine carboxypeptidase/D-alanyl-D-alanine endopeptidase n=1 Tax=Nitrosomonas sp. Nm166 TaxID=1881054 RepID=UPI0008E8BF42|nr:D-alanyl-D-alanine carboxypeptidase/D-alanyl-D-alanine-endopeptidase [Nitrosomonas sp. Nm166]SFE76022.1 D-alanyl-D-alanine carboxypeptidase / D-alanyl-D-alanine-endopeptidase (penicillin-binding protein 4) [Nitrosomonas sp. Nm166]